MWNIREHSVSLIKLISDAIGKKRNSILKDYDITGSQVQILIVLGLAETGECSLKELEHYFCVAQSTIAGIVSRLEAKEFIEGFIDPTDKRIKKIKLTKKGEKVIEEAQGKVEDTEEWLASTLNEGERKELVRLLNKVYDVVK